MKFKKIIFLFVLTLFFSNSIAQDFERERKLALQDKADKSLLQSGRQVRYDSDSVTLGGDPVSSSLKIAIFGDNSQIYRNDGTSWKHQWFKYTSYPGKGVKLYVDGTGYSTNSPTTVTFNGITDDTHQSSYYKYYVVDEDYDNIDVVKIDNYNATITMTKTGYIQVVQTINYPAESDYINYQWEITNLSGSSVSNLQFFTGGDTYSYGSDNGIGFWENDVNSVGVTKEDGTGNSVNLYLQGLQTPYKHESMVYDECRNHIRGEDVTPGLTNTVTTTIHDNAIALEWRKTNLAAGETWTINAIEKFSDKQITNLTVTAPLNETIAPGQTKDIVFVVKNNSTSSISDISLNDIIDLAGWNVNVTNPLGTFNLSIGQSINVTVSVECPILATAGTVAKATLEAIVTAQTADDKAYITVVGSLPGISANPEDQAVCAETENVTFSVSATNNDSYLWQEYTGTWANITNGGVYSDATTNTLSISNVTGLIGNQYRCIVSNSIGDATSESAEITGDSENPVPNITNLPNITGQCSATATYPTATDNCIGEITATTTDPITYNAQGSYSITWSYVDDMGNSVSQTQNIIIDDTTAPVADIPNLPDVTEECSLASLTAPTASDNCSGAITGTTITSFPITETTIVTWTYEDGNGNIATQIQNVIIDDSTAPVADILNLSDITEECSLASLTAPTASDNCSGAITATTITSFPITETTIVTWTYEDGNGNIATQIQNVIIDDVTPPTADETSLLDITEDCSVIITDFPTATDNCSGSITATTSNPLEYNEEGSYIITWNFLDNNGNNTEQNQSVTVINEDPVVFTQDITVTLDENGIASIIPENIDNDSYDDCGITNMSLDISDFTVDDLGENTVILSVIDNSGKSAQETAIVTVIQLDYSIEIPNFISPNNDGKNDFWLIKGVENLQGYTLNIFNKLGEVVYNTTDYNNTWDGMYNNKELSNGTYYYNFTNGVIVHKGFITIVR